eukprot:5142243-Pleurochrysis_carterae.AAC.5
MFALGREHDTCSGASRDDTRSGLVLEKADGTAMYMRGRKLSKQKLKKLRKVARQGLKETRQTKRTKAGIELLAGKRQGQGRREARKARGSSCWERPYRRASHCLALLRPEADGL